MCWGQTRGCRLRSSWFIFLCCEHLKDEEDAFLAKYKKLNEAVVGVIEDYSLVSFIPLHVEVRY